MRILLTNDDGIHAEGLEALERIAASLGDEVWVCGPEYEQSGASRALTLAEPLRVRKLGARKFAVDGTPTDCVMLAVSELMPERPDLVLSGVNRGQNLGEDVSMSGTVAGAIQGMALGMHVVKQGQEISVTTVRPDPKVDIIAPMVFVGYGVSAPEAGSRLYSLPVLPSAYRFWSAGRTSTLRMDSPDCCPEKNTEVQTFCGAVELNDTRRLDAVTAYRSPGCCAGALAGGAIAVSCTSSPESRRVTAPAVAAVPFSRFTW